MTSIAPVAEQEIVEGTHIAGPSRPSELDPFFAGDDNVLKSYAFDYDEIVAYKHAMAWQDIKKQAVNPFHTLLCCPCLVYSVGEFFCFAKENMEEEVRAQHLALSRDGIRYVVDKHRARQCCGLPDLVQGKVSKTVPYDKARGHRAMPQSGPAQAHCLCGPPPQMTDCDVEEPAGYSFVCESLCAVEQTLHVVQVDTASGAGKTESGHELSLEGLVSPEEFKKDVWGMKRGEPIDGVDGTVAPMAVSMARDGPGGGPGSGEGLASLAGTMRELLEVNKQQLACLLALKEKGYAGLQA